MNTSKIFSLSILNMLLVPLFAQAVPLKVVNVSAPDVNCVFNKACKVTVTDTVATFSWPSIIAAPNASAKLQSRTYTGKASAGVVIPGAGKTAYVYRVIALKGGSTDCVTGLVMDFGPVAAIDYNKSGMPSDIFVITKGGLGSVGIKSADKTGNIITFTFSQGICNTVAQDSFFFGLSATKAPKVLTVQATVLGGQGTTSVNVPARVPTH